MSAVEEWNLWRESRLTRVKSPLGNLALVETRWGSDFDSTNLDKFLAQGPKSVEATRLEQKNFSGEIIAKGIRLWDSNSPAIQAFEGIEVFPFDPNWIIRAKFTSHEEARPVAHEFIRDSGGTRDLAVPGVIEVEIDGIQYSLDAFDDDGTLILVFGDPTNGSESYSAGRFLLVYPESESDEVTLNFNHAFVPPCGFSIHYNCPLPPPQNRIQIAIRAGERNPLFSPGYDAH